MKAKVIGIAGSNGKTTSKELISQVLKQKYSIISTQSNFNNHIGVPLTLLTIRPETELAVVEMGANYINELEHLCAIADPDYGIVTNVGKEHLEGFGSFEGVIKTETFLYRYIEKKDGLVFVNKENSLLLEYIGNCKTYTYSKGEDSEIQMCSYENNPFLKVFWKVKNEQSLQEVQTKLIGTYNWENVLAAIAIGNYFEIPKEKIKHAIESYVPSNHRSQWIEVGSNHIVMDAYNANPTSMQVAIENFAALSFPNKVLILGDMLELGKYEIQEHQAILSLINSYSFSKVFLVGTVFSSLDTNNFYHFNTVEELIAYLSKNPITDATVLIKGSHGIHLEKLLSVFSYEK